MPDIKLIVGCINSFQGEKNMNTNIAIQYISMCLKDFGILQYIFKIQYFSRYIAYTEDCFPQFTYMS